MKGNQGKQKKIEENDEELKKIDKMKQNEWKLRNMK